MKLIFRNSYDKERVIANPKTMDETFDEIRKFIDECNTKRIDGRKFKIYYYNIHMHNDTLCIDARSHTEFFYLKREDEEDWPADIKENYLKGAENNGLN